MSAVNWYFRSDTWTVNGLTAYKLTDTAGPGFTYNSATSGVGGGCPGAFYFISYLYVDILHYNGTTTNISYSAAYINSAPTYSDGLWHNYVGTFACPYTPLVSSDALKITLITTGEGQPVSAIFVTDVLRAAAVRNTTWTVNYRSNGWPNNIIQAPYACLHSVTVQCGFGDASESIMGPDILLRGPLPTFFQAV
jgi:hypothetical protein